MSMQRAGLDLRPICEQRKSKFRRVTKCGNVEGGEGGRTGHTWQDGTCSRVLGRTI